MKPSMSHALFFLFITTTQPIFFTTANAGVAVKDSTGQKVVSDAPYRIGPVSGKGGYIKLTDTLNKKKVCPFEVVQDPEAAVISDQFMFTLIGDGKYLQTSSVLGIGSGYFKGACKKSTFWTINDVEGKKAPGNLITTGGGFDDDVTCFQVLEYPKPSSPKVHSYMLQHCPYYCGGTPPVICYNVSMYVHNGVRRLGTAGSTPFEFVFHKIAK